MGIRFSEEKSKMSIFWLFLLAPIISQSLAQFSTEDDDLFVVYDYFNDGDSSHKQPPSCILATFKAKLILDDGIELDILPSNLTWISTHNHTCGEEHQTLELFWDEDSSMILSFTREPNSVSSENIFDLTENQNSDCFGRKLCLRKSQIPQIRGIRILFFDQCPIRQIEGRSAAIS